MVIDDHVNNAFLSLKNSLLCKLCNNTINNPLILDCGHFFCSDCILKSVNLFDCIHCNICFQITKSKNLKKSQLLQNIISTFNTISINITAKSHLSTSENSDITNKLLNQQVNEIRDNNINYHNDNKIPSNLNDFSDDDYSKNSSYLSQNSNCCNEIDLSYDFIDNLDYDRDSISGDDNVDVKNVNDNDDWIENYYLTQSNSYKFSPIKKEKNRNDKSYDDEKMDVYDRNENVDSNIMSNSNNLSNKKEDNIASPILSANIINNTIDLCSDDEEIIENNYKLDSQYVSTDIINPNLSFSQEISNTKLLTTINFMCQDTIDLNENEVIESKNIFTDDTQALSADNYCNSNNSSLTINHDNFTNENSMTFQITSKNDILEKPISERDSQINMAISNNMEILSDSISLNPLTNNDLYSDTTFCYHTNEFNKIVNDNIISSRLLSNYETKSINDNSLTSKISSTCILPANDNNEDLNNSSYNNKLNQKEGNCTNLLEEISNNFTIQNDNSTDATCNVNTISSNKLSSEINNNKTISQNHSNNETSISLSINLYSPNEPLETKSLKECDSNNISDFNVKESIHSSTSAIINIYSPNTNLYRNEDSLNKSDIIVDINNDDHLIKQNRNNSTNQIRRKSTIELKSFIQSDTMTLPDETQYNDSILLKPIGNNVDNNLIISLPKTQLTIDEQDSCKDVIKDMYRKSKLFNQINNNNEIIINPILQRNNNLVTNSINIIDSKKKEEINQVNSNQIENKNININEIRNKYDNKINLFNQQQLNQTIYEDNLPKSNKRIKSYDEYNQINKPIQYINIYDMDDIDDNNENKSYNPIIISSAGKISTEIENLIKICEEKNWVKYETSLECTNNNVIVIMQVHQIKLNYKLVKKTTRYIKALGYGCWIVDSLWLSDSIKENKLIDDLKKYEISGTISDQIIGGPKRAREGDPSIGAIRLFSNYLFYILPDDLNNTYYSIDEIIWLIRRNGGDICNMISHSTNKNIIVLSMKSKPKETSFSNGICQNFLIIDHHVVYYLSLLLDSVCCQMIPNNIDSYKVTL